MEDWNEWNRFMRSGKIEDYLRYAQKAETTQKTEGREPDTYAGFANGDRTHTEGGTHRGV